MASEPLRRTEHLCFDGERINAMRGMRDAARPLVAQSICNEAEFFLFGTHDLKQMTLGFSRDDSGQFLPEYVKRRNCEHDPFRSIDRKGAGTM